MRHQIVDQFLLAAPHRTARLCGGLVLVLTIFLLAACGAGSPQISAATTRLELGDVPNGQVVSRDVTVRNDGDAALVVESVSTSCGCTSATLDSMQIGPGQSATLQVKFDSGAHGPELTGAILRQIFINSNDPSQPELTIEIAANVTPPQ